METFIQILIPSVIAIALWEVIALFIRIITYEEPNYKHLNDNDNHSHLDYKYRHDRTNELKEW